MFRLTLPEEEEAPADPLSPLVISLTARNEGEEKGADEKVECISDEVREETDGRAGLLMLFQMLSQELKNGTHFVVWPSSCSSP